MSNQKENTTMSQECRGEVPPEVAHIFELSDEEILSEVSAEEIAHTREIAMAAISEFKRARKEE